MAEDEHTSAPAPRNDWPLTAEAVQKRIEADRQARDARAVALGQEIVDRTRKRLRRARMATSADPIEQAFLDYGRPVGVARGPISASKAKGPQHGKKYRTPQELEAATVEACAAGFEATWGYRLTDKTRDAFKVANNILSNMDVEKRAREIYSELREAIVKAHDFANTSYGLTNGSAVAALAELWGALPILPPLRELPFYEKDRGVRRVLAEQWQAVARSNLYRELSATELAQMSILLGYGPGKPYAKHLKNKGETALEVSPSQVVDDEAKRFSASQVKRPPE
jgi:hypothetical protein